MRYLVLVFTISFIGHVSAQVELVKDINPSAPAFETNEKLVVYNSKLIFPANDGVTGNELWVSDGTEAGTILLKDINPGANNSFPLYLTATSNRLYFRGFSDDEGWELYYTDGTSAGTILNVDLISGTAGSSPANLYAAQNNLFYIADNPVGGGRELFVTNSTITADALSSFATDNINSLRAAALKDSLIFALPSAAGSDPFGLEPYFATSSSIGLLKDLDPGMPSTLLSGFKSIGAQVYFFADTTATGDNFDLWKTDGTEGGTVLIKELPENSVGDLLTPVESGLFFFVASAPGIGPELWVSDGTEAGTELVKIINPSNTLTGSEITSITAAGDRVFFAAQDGSSGKELWVSDGTEAGTYLVKDINPGAAFGFDATINPTIWYNGNLYFAADDGTNGIELWVTDGTETGTQLLEDVNPGSSGSDPAQLALFNGSIYFIATDATYGRELRKFTPTAGATISGLITDIDSGDPLANVSVENISQNKFSLSDGSGQYTIVAAAEDTIVFTLNDFVPDSVMVVEGQSVYDIKLQFNSCYEVSCDLGEVCVNGECVDPCSTLECADDEYCEDGTCIPIDPCVGVDCLLGQVCYDGSCYTPVVSGIVKDQLQQPLDSVLVYHIELNDSIYSDVAGNFIINEPGNYLFYKAGYFAKTMYLTEGNRNIILTINPCEMITCPLGKVCYGGSCYDPAGEYNFTFIVKDALDQEPIANIKVSLLNNYNNVIKTDANGVAAITTTDQTPIIFRDTTGTYSALIITPSNQNQEILLSRSDCDGVSCPLGQTCFDGSCYDPSNIDEVLTGYVFDADSLPLPNVYVSIGSNQTSTTASGYFELEVPSNTDSLFVTASKTSYGAFEFEMFKNQINEIYLFVDDECFNVSCPLGQVCLEGSCYTTPINDPNPDLCEDVFCPLGQVCYGGSCHDPCIEGGPEICYDNLANACANTQCPLGQVCENGVCYDPCEGDNDSNDICYNSSLDQCENIIPPPGYICQNGIVVPDCPGNGPACQTASICNVVACPPGDICFTCFDPSGINSSGISNISGQINLTPLNTGGRVDEEPNSDLFVYLIELNTGVKTAIAKTDADGNFSMSTIPEGSYQVFLIARGYFMEQMIVEVSDYENLILDFTSIDRVVKMEVSRITSSNLSQEQAKSYWFPSPNTTCTFYMSDSKTIEEVELYDSQGKCIELSYDIESDQARNKLIIHNDLRPGLYMLKWRTNKSDVQQIQRILLR